MSDTLGERIKAKRDARLASLEELKRDLVEHIDVHMAALHARLDKLGEQ